MDEVKPESGWLAGIIDAVIKAYLWLISLVWISGGFAFAVGPISKCSKSPFHEGGFHSLFP